MYIIYPFLLDYARFFDDDDDDDVCVRVCVCV